MEGLKILGSKSRENFLIILFYFILNLKYKLCYKTEKLFL